MRRTKIFFASLAVVVMLSSTAADATDDLARARAATAAFHQLDAATNGAGFGGPLEDLAGITCITNPGVGVMGIHYVNGKRVADAVLDPALPEVLVYQPLPNGKLRLVAAEYVIFQGAWLESGGTGTPTLFGQPMNFVPLHNRYGLPPFYEIHAWIWMNNPAGIFKDWNPSGSCA